jgi:hypothetical protein
MFIKIDSKWINAESIIGLSDPQERLGVDAPQNATDIMLANGRSVMVHVGIDNVLSILMTRTTLSFEQPRPIRKTISATEADDMESKFFTSGWSGALREVYRRIMAIHTGRLTHEDANKRVRAFLEEQLGEDALAKMDSEWQQAVDDETKLREAVTLRVEGYDEAAQVNWPKIAEQLNAALSETKVTADNPTGVEVPVVAVSEPETPPDAKLRSVATGEMVANLTMPRKQLDDLVKVANNGSNISNYAMGRRLMELLGVELS